VKDNGAGFEMRYYGKLFGLYETLHAPGEFEGAGVGLALARRIVERHGGEIWAESAPGAGAAFCFTLGEKIAMP
jgi:light-regulated signal transduction histidine kinase (bacteriophytochrome)